MRLSMSFKSRRELLEQVAPRYREANRKQKAIILDEFIASTGYARKYAIRLLALPVIPSIKEIKRPRSPHYGIEVQKALRMTWAAANFIVAERKVRTGRNPKTGEVIQIPESRTVKFRPLERLKEDFN